MYQYRAELLKVVDGDTIDVKLDLGFHTFRVERIRLSLIDAYEMSTTLGKEAKAWLVSKLSFAKEIYIETDKDKKGKYGRYLGLIYIDDETTSINEQLVKEGFATFKTY